MQRPKTPLSQPHLGNRSQRMHALSRTLILESTRIMAGVRLPLQDAEVLWWNNSSIYVRCPFCEAIHHHGFTGYPGSARTISRVSHCDGPRSGSYNMVFPLDKVNSKAWYSIDKTRALFVAAGENPSDYFKQFESKDDPRCNKIRIDAREALRTKRRWHEAWEILTTDLKAFSIAVGDLCCGRHDAVQRYLHTSKEADIFLHGIQEYVYDIPPDRNCDDEGNPLGGEEDSHNRTVRREVRTTTGRTTLHLAARGDYPRLVRLLLEHGADPNARDVDGRTPLMESCLWGRLHNVRLLIQYGADNGIPCVRDGQRYLPVDFARDTEENAEERRNLSDEEVYNEDTSERGKDRKIIVSLLEDPSQGPQRGDGDRRNLWGFAFTKAPHDATMVTFTAHFDIPNEYKTIGILYRGTKFPTVAAMSGWGHSEWEIDNVQVAGKVWTGEVRALCQRIGFRLGSHSRDLRIPGQYNACHAEKQLVAYFVDQHFVGGCQDSTEETPDLITVVPPVSVRSAEIMASRPICDDCHRFVRHVNKALGLSISVVASVL